MIYTNNKTAPDDSRSNENSLLSPKAMYVTSLMISARSNTSKAQRSPGDKRNYPIQSYRSIDRLLLHKSINAILMSQSLMYGL